jgi:hypothetical protein
MLTKTKPDDVRESDRTRQIAACLADAIIALQKQGRFSEKSEIFSEVADDRLDSFANSGICVDSGSISESHKQNQGENR